MLERQHAESTLIISTPLEDGGFQIAHFCRLNRLSRIKTNAIDLNMYEFTIQCKPLAIQ